LVRALHPKNQIDQLRLRKPLEFLTFHKQDESRTARFDKGVGNYGRQRTAKPAPKGDPIAQIVPVTDIMKAISASKQGKSATVEG
ncbi:hypothetical protein, partial [Mucilaginibacter sp. 5C4]|uniref:hypothetical protein n=1 Tax=Mucilaginibacter sp. 5C4 TaxID=3048589 RepID=UPI002B221EC9